MRTVVTKVVAVPQGRAGKIATLLLDDGSTIKAEGAIIRSSGETEL